MILRSTSSRRMARGWPKLCRAVVLLLLVHGVPGWAGPPKAGARSDRGGPRLPPVPVLSPTALTADAGDGRAYLRWNPQLADPRVIGWRVLQLRPKRRAVTKDVLSEPAIVVRNLSNGTPYEFTVVGVLADGSTTPPSNTAAVTPRDVGKTRLSDLRRGQKIQVGRFQDVEVERWPIKAIFPDGQELTYEALRPLDWKTRDGKHLIYPKHFGNGLDIGQFDERGLPKVLPPKRRDGTRWGNPHVTQPMTLPHDVRHHDAWLVWKQPQVDGDRVTFHYWLPLEAMGYRAWTYVLVWETWWPIERERRGCKYHGLARLVEVQMPSALKHGYQVMLNNGFGPGGSREGVVSYSTGFREPGREIVDFSGGRNRQVIFQSPKPARRGAGYHPNHDCLQASPLIFYDWGTGGLTIAARSLYYHCSNNSASYVEQGADGVWPNLAWDLAVAGKRTAVDTIEYLYTSDVAQPLPQRFINARFEAYSSVSRRMGVQDELGAVAMDTPHSQIEGDGGPLPFAEKYIRKLAGSGIDVVAMYHDAWHAVPITVDDAYRLDERHDSNPLLKAMCDKFRAAGLASGFWFRPEFTKTSLPNALSESIPTARTYYGYDMAKYPNVVRLLNQRGIPLFRQNTNWVRRRRDGSWPKDTPYQWVPMSLATGWWDRIMWPTLRMSAKLGFRRVLVDGGFGGLQGVDYTPMLNGDAAGAVACQPYWWRMWRTMHLLGVRMFGECTVGWKGGNVSVGGAGDEHYAWMFQMGWYVCGRHSPRTPQFAHRLYQLYNSNRGDMGSAAVRRYAKRFHARNRPPDWIELKGLRQGEPVELTAAAGDTAAADRGTSTPGKGARKVSVRPWTWTDVVWHYNDGTSVVYPAYSKIDWAKE